MSDSEVYIGERGLATYLEAVEYQLDENNECTVVARGKDNNATAIDVACIIKRRYDVEVSSFDLHTDGFYENEDEEQVEINDEYLQGYEDSDLSIFEQYEEEGYEVTKVSGLRITLE